MKILTAKQMAAVDRSTTEVYKIPSLLLMENAGRAVVDELEKAYPKLYSSRILIFSGKGNNGGDGLVVARYLKLRGAEPEIVIFGDPSQFRGDALTNWEIVHSLGIPFRSVTDAGEWRHMLTSIRVPDVIVDAILGTGLTKPIGPDLKPVVDWMNQARSSSFIASVDIPSGLFADAAQVVGTAVQAHLTVTFTALKLAQVIPPAADYVGRLVVASIGSPATLLDNPEFHWNLVDRTHVMRAVPSRHRESHKGNYGHVYAVAGSRGKGGAAIMTGMAALRSGAGLVTLWLAEGLQPYLAGRCPELMTERLPETTEGTLDAGGSERVVEHLSQADALVLGPGLTTNSSTVALVRDVVRRSSVPIVLDADGINAFAGDPRSIRNDCGQPIVITPHPGEMARLLGRRTSDVQANRLATAVECARQSHAFTVLKGFQTVIATPQGDIFVNTTGNPGMASGGTGDILAGMLGRFVAGWMQKGEASNASLVDHICAAVHLHGLSGDFALADKGAESLIAGDLLEYFPQAFRSISGP